MVPMRGFAISIDLVTGLMNNCAVTVVTGHRGSELWKEFHNE
jgi:hypothetical protein